MAATGCGGGPGQGDGEDAATESNDTGDGAVDDGLPPVPYETWVRQVPTDGGCYRYGTAAAPTRDGGVAFAGFARPAIGSDGGDAWIGKLSPAGDVEWSFELGGAGLEWVSEVSVLPDGRILVVSSTSTISGTLDDDVLLVAVGEGGEIERQVVLRAPESERANGVAVMSDGSVIVTGYGGSSGSGMGHAFALKLAPDLSIMWQKRFDGPLGDNNAGTLAPTADGGGFVAVRPAGVGTAWAARFDGSGGLVWQRDLGMALAMTDHSRSMAISTIPDDGVLIAVTAESGVHAVGLDRDGGLAWAMDLGGNWVRAASPLPDGTVLVIGCDETEGYDGWIASIGAGGVVLWKTLIDNDMSPLSGRAVFPTSDGGVLAMASGCGDTWFAKLTAEGAFYSDCDHLIRSVRASSPVSVTVTPGTAIESDAVFEAVDVDLPVTPSPAATSLECSGTLP